MSVAITLATARRVLAQLRHDPRSIAILVLVPTVLMILLRYVFNSEEEFSQVAPALLGVFPLVLMFIITSVTTLRERSSGTLERLMTTPLASSTCSWDTRWRLRSSRSCRCSWSWA